MPATAVGNDTAAVPLALGAAAGKPLLLQAQGAMPRFVMPWSWSSSASPARTGVPLAAVREGCALPAADRARAAQMNRVAAKIVQRNVAHAATGRLVRQWMVSGELTRSRHGGCGR